MIRPLVALCALVFTVCALVLMVPVAHAKPHPVEGTWTGSLKDDAERLQLSMRIEHNGENGMDFRISDFQGLTLDQVRSQASTDVQFKMAREAGTISFEGMFRNRHGAGDFVFASNPGFLDELHRLGIERSGEKSDEKELFELALFDVSSKFIRSMQEIGYDESLDRYVEFRIFNVTPEYVREMRAVGFDHLSSAKLVETRIHGATPEYIRDMRAHGEDLSLDKYIESRIFQVTPEFASEMAREGYSGLDRSDLVQFRIHGVTTDFIRELKGLGYTHVPAEKLVEMRIHGVTPEFITRLEKAGYHKVPIDKMVQMRIFGIEPEMVKAFEEAGK